MSLLLDALPGAAVAAVLVGVGRAVVAEPLGLALWCVVVAWLMLPLAWDAPLPHASAQVRAGRYVVANLIITLATVLFAGAWPGVIVAAVACSLLGNVWLLGAMRVPTALAVGLTLLITGLAFTWPVWAATLITRVDTDPWLQWLINVSPAFALNAAISPEDPLTHRPLAYQLMNLGQDVMYSMPASAWPCVLLHAGVGVLGMMGRGLTRMNADESKNFASS